MQRPANNTEVSCTEPAVATQGSAWIRWALLAAGTVGALAVANAIVTHRTPPLDNPFSLGDAGFHPTPEGDIWYAVAGSGPPLLLLHGIGAGCSSHEWASVLPELCQHFRVYAFDLPGFGKSTHPAIPYSTETLCETILDFCNCVIAPNHPGIPTHGIASSLSAGWLTQLAVAHPEHFGNIVLVSPTGMERTASDAVAVVAKTMLRVPVIGEAIYNLLTHRRAIQSTLQRRIHLDPATVDEVLVSRYHTAAHQPGASRFLPFFVGGDLACPLAAAISRVKSTTLIVSGGLSASPEAGDAASLHDLRPDLPWSVISEAGALPHQEQPDAFLARVLPFLLQSPPAQA